MRKQIFALGLALVVLVTGCKNTTDPISPGITNTGSKEKHRISNAPRYWAKYQHFDLDLKNEVIPHTRYTFSRTQVETGLCLYGKTGVTRCIDSIFSPQGCLQRVETFFSVVEKNQFFIYNFGNIMQNHLRPYAAIQAIPTWDKIGYAGQTAAGTPVQGILDMIVDGRAAKWAQDGVYAGAKPELCNDKEYMLHLNNWTIKGQIGGMDADIPVEFAIGGMDADIPVELTGKSKIRSIIHNGQFIPGQQYELMEYKQIQ